MACYYHPNAAIVAVCKRCRKELCGMCTMFLEHGEHCEPCAAAIESENFVRERSASLNRPAGIEKPGQSQQSRETAPARRRIDDKLYVWLGIGVSSAMIFVGCAFYAFPTLLMDADTLSRLEQQQRLDNCRLVFEEISYQLRAGELPDESKTCEGVSVPNIVRRAGETVRVEHPNPAMLGLREMYVTSESYQVVMLGGEGS